MAAIHRLMNVFLRRAWTGQFTRRPCSHLDMISDVQPASEVCQQCVALGDSWPALRMCLTCGHVGCCEKTRNQHALKHFQATGHPLARPYKERGMNWIWCYLDKTLLDSPAT
jgi:uncharacterized UBP type Zn finger protein